MLIAATVIFLVGFIDDIREISAPAKVFGTVIAGRTIVAVSSEAVVVRTPRSGRSHEVSSARSRSVHARPEEITTSPAIKTRASPMTTPRTL